MIKDFDKIILGKRIKQLRLQKGLTQDALSEKLLIDSSMLSNFETGKNAPSISNLVKIINALDIEPNELFEYEHLIDENKLDDIIAEMYNSLSLDKKQCLFRLMKFLMDTGK